MTHQRNPDVLLLALREIAKEAGEYADGADDSHYLARAMCNIEAIAKRAIAATDPEKTDAE